MPVELLSRTAMIEDCCVFYGVHPRFFRNMEQQVLDRAWFLSQTWDER